MRFATQIGTHFLLGDHNSDSETVFSVRIPPAPAIYECLYIFGAYFKCHSTTSSMLTFPSRFVFRLSHEILVRLLPAGAMQDEDLAIELKLVSLDEPVLVLVAMSDVLPEPRAQIVKF